MRRQIECSWAYLAQKIAVIIALEPVVDRLAGRVAAAVEQLVVEVQLAAVQSLEQVEPEVGLELALGLAVAPPVCGQVIDVDQT